MYQNEEKVQTRRRKTDTAIQLARENRWEEAVAANRAILKLFPNDADSHNRLGKALMELGRYSEAKRSYKKALDLDPTNRIARNNRQRLDALIKTGAAHAETSHVDPSLFIEEMGKSAITVLQQTVPEILATLNAGDRIELRRRGNTLAVETPGGAVVGAVEPKLRARLIKLMESGNQYAAAVTSLSYEECRIIIKETYQDPSQAGRPSFPAAATVEGTRPYTKERLIRHDGQGDEPDREKATEEEIEGEGDGRPGWANERVLQEGHVRISEAAAAEEAQEEELEE